MKLAKNKDKVLGGLFAILVFIGVFLFLYIAHPLIISDTDDWYYASYWRRPLPIFNSFNSIKVFPETFFPLCSLFAVNVIMPFIKNYLMSLAFVYAAVGAVFITAYILMAARICQRIIPDLSPIISYVSAICFLMFHFLLYKNNWTGNDHLLWSHDVTCFFHYTLTALLNACLVMFFMKHESFDKRSISLEVSGGEYFKGGILVLLIYFAVFSNMFTNIILAAYSGIHLLICIITRRTISKKSVNSGKPVSVIIREYWLHILELALWVIALIFQMFDLRNENAQAQGATGSLFGALETYIGNFTLLNKMAVIFIIVIMFLFAMNLFLGKLSFEIPFVEALSDFVIVSVYLIVLSGVASPKYLSRCDVKIGVYFYILLLVVMMIMTMVKANPRMLLLLPLFAFILSSQSINYCKPFKDYNMNGFSYEAEKRISEDIMSQFVAADEDGVNVFELHVVKSSGDNWPYPDYAGEIIGDTLFRHGMISRRITATTVFDTKKNADLKVDF